VLNQILTEMDGLLELRGVVVMGATNRLDMVDPALLRTGRFDRLVYIGEPIEEDRMKILSIHTRSMPIAGSALDEFIGAVEHLSESELETLLEPLGSDQKITLGELSGKLPATPKPGGEEQNPLPRKRILSILSAHRLTLEDPVRDTLLGAIAKNTTGYVGSDLEGVCREAGMLAMRDGSSFVEERHFEAASGKIHAMMNDNVREYYRRMREFFKGGLPKEVQPPEYQ
jgi:transitional endoplasmic reticulum ATPase